MEQKSRMTAIGLTILWIVSFLVVFILSATLRIKSSLSGENVVDIASSIGAYLFSGLYFFPLLLQIKKFALHAKMEKLASWAHCFSLLFVGVLVLFPVALMVMLMAS